MCEKRGTAERSHWDIRMPSLTWRAGLLHQAHRVPPNPEGRLNAPYHDPSLSGHKCQRSPSSRQAWRNVPAVPQLPGEARWAGTCPSEGPEVKALGAQSFEEPPRAGIWEASSGGGESTMRTQREKEKKNLLWVWVRGWILSWMGARLLSVLFDHSRQFLVFLSWPEVFSATTHL